jgi:hypothetical protein
MVGRIGFKNSGRKGMFEINGNSGYVAQASSPLGDCSAAHRVNAMDIDIYGLKITCRADSPELARSVTRPFEPFVRSAAGRAPISITVCEKPIEYDSFPEIPASFSSPRNIIYFDRKSGRKIIDYFGKGVVLEDGNHSRYEITGPDRNFLQEAFYLLVMSLLGRFCDSHGLIRIHALAVSYGDTPFILPISAGGGKSTMALQLLKNPAVKLISDDEPIFSHSGHVLPLPLRIGTLNPDLIQSIPKVFVYTVDRMEFGTKHFIDCRYWDSQIERRFLKNPVIILLKRVLNGRPCIRKVAKRVALKSLMRDAVVGVGLYQGVEFLFSESNLEIIKKINILFKRISLVIKLLNNSNTYQAVLTNHTQENAESIMGFIRTVGAS